MEAAQKYGDDTKKAWSRERIEETVAKYDRNKDGQLDKKEWQQALVELSKPPPAAGVATKAKASAKYIYAAPAAAAPAATAPSETDQRRRANKASAAALESAKSNAKSVFVSADTDRDEELSVREFIVFLKQVQSRHYCTHHHQTRS